MWTQCCRRTPSSPPWSTRGATCWTTTPSFRLPHGGRSSSTSSSTSSSACLVSSSSSCPSCRNTRFNRFVLFVWLFALSFYFYSPRLLLISLPTDRAGQAGDLGETVEVFQDAAVQPLLYPAAFDLWDLLLH